MKKIPLLLTLLLSTTAHATVFKCTIADKIVYTGTPCDAGATTQKLRTWESSFDSIQAISVSKEVITLKSNSRSMVAVSQYCTAIGEFASDVLKSRKLGLSYQDALNITGNKLRATEMQPFSGSYIVRSVYNESIHGTPSETHMRHWAECKDKYKFI